MTKQQIILKVVVTLIVIAFGLVSAHFFWQAMNGGWHI